MDHRDHRDDELFLAEPAGTDPGAAAGRSRGRRAGLVAAAAVLVAVVVVPVALVVAGRTPAPRSGHNAAHLGKGAAFHQVLTALSATTDSGNFNFSYTLANTPGTPNPSATTTTTCQPETVVVPSGVLGGRPSPLPDSASPGVSNAPMTTLTPTTPVPGLSVPPNEPVVTRPMTTLPPGFKLKTESICPSPSPDPSAVAESGGGSGTIDISPMAMVVSAQLSSPSGTVLAEGVSLRVDGSSVYEDLGSTDTSLAPPASQSDGSGQPISSFASLAEGTIGSRVGAVAMLGLATPTGYLDLDQESITGADQVGTGSVDGAPVTVYGVSEDPAQLENSAGISPVEEQTIADAVTVLDKQGYTGTTADVSIDDSGFIREVKATTAFSDGGTVVLDVTFSDFGCAGTVLMPGQTGSGSAPSGCTSPDTGSPSTATTAPGVTTTTAGPDPSGIGSPTQANRAAQSDLVSAINVSSTVFANNATYGDTAEAAEASLASAAPELKFSPGPVSYDDNARNISVEVSSDGQILVLATQSATGECWYAEDNQETTSDDDAMANAGADQGIGYASSNGVRQTTCSASDQVVNWSTHFPAS